MQSTVLAGKNIDILEMLYEDNYFDSIVTDPPYGLGKEPDPMDVMRDWVSQGFHTVKNKGGFMGKEWDAFVPQPNAFKECYRVLKPGGYILCACGTRTQDWMAMSLRFAGFEIRDIISQHYGSGFPKSMDVSKAIDSKFGAVRIKVDNGKTIPDIRSNNYENSTGKTRLIQYDELSSTDEAKQWEGWGTALKPATELWTLARKPLSEPTVAENVLKYGTGGLNIDGCRIATDEIITNHSRGAESAISKGKYGDSKAQQTHQTEGQQSGRWPANVIFDEFTGGLLDEQSGHLKSGNLTGQLRGHKNVYGAPSQEPQFHVGDSGGVSRFFYCAKAGKAERNKGLEGTNNHETVKPLTLMRFLCRLITPPNGIILDPYNGSGTTGIAAKLEGFSYVGIEQDREHVQNSIKRIAAW